MDACRVVDEHRVGQIPMRKKLSRPAQPAERRTAEIVGRDAALNFFS